MLATQTRTRGRRDAAAKNEVVVLEQHRAEDSEDEAADDLHLVRLPREDRERAK